MLRPNEFAELVDAFPTIRELDQGDQQSIGMYARLVVRPKQTVLFDELHRCHAYIMVTMGQVAVTTDSDEGRRMLLYRVGRGETCLLTTNCLLSGANYLARGEVEAPLRAVMLAETSFHNLLSSSRQFREFVFSAMGIRLSDLLGLVNGLAFTRVDQRLAATILKMGDQAEITHETLAVEVGSVREVVSRALKAFERKGLVRLGRGQIHICDAKGLSAIASAI